MKKAVILLSGGIDSTVAAYLVKKVVGKTGELYTLTFDYGQLHRKEIVCSSIVSGTLEASEHIVVPIQLNLIGGSSLVGKGDIPTEGLTEEIPSTWVPQRNAIFLAIAFGWAEVVGANLVYAGLNIVDYSGYPDCRPEFVEAMQKALNLASKQFVTEGRVISIITPLSGESKTAIVKLGSELGVDFSKTWSCYKGGEKACGKCDSCRIRLVAFEKAGLVDPLEYEE